MKRVLWSLICVALVIPSVSHGASPADGLQPVLREQTAAGEIVGWKSFHEGVGVKTGDVWQLGKDGVLTCKGLPLGYLYTEQAYTSFVLRFEFRWPPGKQPGRGGLLFRITGDDKIWPKSLEAQINTGDVGDFWGLAGFKLSGPAERLKRLENPQFGLLTNLKKTADVEKKNAEWNTYEIEARGDKVTLRVNGQVVNQAEGCDVVAGRICVTSEGNEIHFRNFQLQTLDAKP